MGITPPPRARLQSDLVGVVMFDGVSRNGTFADAVQALNERDIPVYQIAAPPQAWNADGVTTDDLVAALPGQFVGVELVDGSHVDSMLGRNAIVDFVLQLVTNFSPAGNTEAVYTLATGWINDMYGAGPANPQFGIYGQPGQPIVLGEATAIVLPTAGAAMASAIAPIVAATGPTLINVIGTAFFNILDTATKIISGPPSVPAGSKVRVERVPLYIDCGDGYTVDADWYFPTEGPPPDKLIYFQHGAFAVAGFYNVTAAELAERNHAIVVAPSITSNLFACDGCMESGDPMHAAVARLFLDDRAALLASAKAAGYAGEELQQRFVITGRSGGGQLAAGAAGDYTRLASAERDHDLAGVLLLDTSPVGGAVSRGVANIPMDIPVYAIGARRTSSTPTATPSHVRGCATGQVRRGQAGRRQSLGCVADHQHAGPGRGRPGHRLPAAPERRGRQDLAQGWITDWYETDPDAEPVGFYGPLGTTKDLATDDGVAHVYILRAPAPQLSPLIWSSRR